MSTNQNSCVILENRGVIAITGSQSQEFLQGLITNDISRLNTEPAIYAALLTPQGKFLHDLFLIEQGKTIYVDCERDRLEDLLRRLTLYKLRKDVTITDLSGSAKVIAWWGDQTAQDLPLSFPDPRLAKLGMRTLCLDEATFPSFIEKPFSTYDDHRLSLGIPDGSRDMIIDKAIPLESGLDDLNAIDWNKGCYLGQEIINRTEHRGKNKRILQVSKIESNKPIKEGETLVDDNDQPIGIVVNHCSINTNKQLILSVS